MYCISNFVAKWTGIENLTIFIDLSLFDFNFTDFGNKQILVNIMYCNYSYSIT